MNQDLRVVFGVIASIVTAAAAQPVFPTVNSIDVSSFNAASLERPGQMVFDDDDDADSTPPFISVQTVATAQVTGLSRAEARTSMNGTILGSGFQWSTVYSYLLDGLTTPGGAATRQAEGDWSFNIAVTLDEPSRATFGITQGDLDGASIDLFEPLVITGPDGIVLNHDPLMGNTIYTIDLSPGDYTFASRQQWSASSVQFSPQSSATTFRINTSFQEIPAPSAAAALNLAAFCAFRRRR